MNRGKKGAEKIQLDHKKTFYRQIVETTNEGIWVIDGEGILGMFTDITELKRTQEELQELNRTLVHRVDRRTRKLQESEERRTQLAVDLVSAHDEEQRRISEGLHDHVLQLLAAVKMKQGLLGTNRKNPEKAELLQDITGLLNETIEKIRSLSFELKTSMLISMGLSQAIRELCEAMESMYGVHFEFECEDPELPLSSDVSKILFKGIRELFFNVVKHAGVTRAAVSLKRRSKNLQLTVSDQGRGFRAPIPGEMKPMGKGLGLITIQEWLRDVGGRVEIDSTPGSHTRISLWASLDENW